jgi:hypothetical protein
MTLEENAKLAALLNIILKSTKIIQNDFKNDIEKHATSAFNNLHEDIVSIMDWNGSKLTSEHKIHDVGFYFIGQNDGLSKESKIANDKGIKFDECFDCFVENVQEIITKEE